VACSNGCNCGCNMGESSGIIKWPTKMGEVLGTIWVNQVG
jgi:hypothetical protein